MGFLTASYTDTSNKQNQDRVLIKELSQSVVIALADGVGGRVYGAEAAERAVNLICEFAARHENDLHKPKFWTTTFEKLDELLFRHEQTGETTLVALALTPRGICGASVGDSIGWLVSPQETRVLTSGQYKGFLGSSISTPVSFQEKKLNGTLMLATDGVWKYSDHEQLQTLAQLPDLKSAAQQIVESVRLPSGAFWDDTTVALCHKQI
jgi:serine/threonine protein phosphatase PrpC